MRDRRGCENQLANHLSQLESPNSQVQHEKFFDNFPNEAMMKVVVVATPSFADFSNYLVSGIIQDFAKLLSFSRST